MNWKCEKSDRTANFYSNTPTSRRACDLDFVLLVPMKATSRNLRAISLSKGGSLGSCMLWATFFLVVFFVITIIIKPVCVTTEEATARGAAAPL